jgi:hypothetical protein
MYLLTTKWLQNYQASDVSIHITKRDSPFHSCRGHQPALLTLPEIPVGKFATNSCARKVITKRLAPSFYSHSRSEAGVRSSNVANLPLCSGRKKNILNSEEWSREYFLIFLIPSLSHNIWKQLSGEYGWCTFDTRRNIVFLNPLKSPKEGH